MATLEYSDAALNIRAAFFGASKMLYVEGEDDIIFWECILKAFDKSGYEIESVGGIEELKKRIAKIESGAIDSVAASDSDFAKLDPQRKVVNNVIVTYGHSIENSLINSRSLHRLARVYGRLPNGLISEQDFDDWLSDIETHFNDLVIYDAANQLHGLGAAVLSDNCTRFMTSQHACSPSATKIAAATSQLENNPDLAAHIPAVKTVFATSGHRAIDFMRGHFLASAAMKKVNRLMQRNGARKSVNNDSFTSSLMLGFSEIFDSGHPHYEHYRSEVSRV